MVMVLLTVGRAPLATMPTGSMPLANLVASTAWAASLSAVTALLARLPASTTSAPRSLLPTLPTVKVTGPAGCCDSTPSTVFHLAQKR